MKTHRLALALCLATAAAFLALPLPSSFAHLYGNDYNSGVLYDINTTTGAATNPRGSGATFLAGIAFDPAGNLYGLTTFSSSPANSLVRINPTTGVATLVGATGLSNIFEGDLAFNPLNGNLYGIQNVPTAGARNLFQINPTTGLATTIGSLGGSGDYSALAFNNVGVLFTIDSGVTGNSVLDTVNPLTGAVLTSVTMNVDLGSAVGLAFNPATGTAYVADGVGTNTLYTLNPLTGVATPIGALGVTSLAGLAFRPVPESSTGAIIGAGVLTLLGVQRVRRSRHAKALV